MKISVAMATYNGEKYLIEQLDSLRDQTMPIDELIFTDDGSKDNTPAMIRKYIEDNGLSDRWHFYVNEKNLGYADNFHKALSMCTGDYVFFADQDDIWMTNKIEEMVKTMEEHKEIKMLCCDFEPFASCENPPTVPQYILDSMDNSGRLEHLPLVAKNVHINSLGCLMGMPRAFVDVAENYWYSGWAHDEYVWKLAEVMDGLYVLHKNLIKRRLHENNVTMRKFHTIESRMKYLTELLKSHEATLKCAKDQNVDAAGIKLLEREIEATKTRMDIVGKKKIFKSFKMLGYLDCYHSKKSLLMEPWLAIKGK